MTSKKTAADAVTDLSFEEAQHELEAVVQQLEDPATGLDSALELWERGELLHAYCQSKLDYAAARLHKVQVTADDAAQVVAEGGDDFAHSANGTSDASVGDEPEDIPDAMF